jgi:hypothetical protein
MKILSGVRVTTEGHTSTPGKDRSRANEIGKALYVIRMAFEVVGHCLVYSQDVEASDVCHLSSLSHSVE